MAAIKLESIFRPSRKTLSSFLSALAGRAPRLAAASTAAGAFSDQVEKCSQAFYQPSPGALRAQVPPQWWLELDPI